MSPPNHPCLQAERGGFEPPNEVDPRYAISSRARSTAPAPLRAAPSLAYRLACRLYSCQPPSRSSGISPPSQVSPVTATCVAPDHEVDVDLAAVDCAPGPARPRRRTRTPGRARCGWRRSHRAACRRSTVSSAADPALAIDERDLAEARGTVDHARQRPRSTSAPCSASISTARPRSNRTRRPVTERAGGEQRLGRRDDPVDAPGSGVVNTSSVGMLGA